jgi:hypothetical protein
LGDPQAAFSSQRLSIALDALARCYDFVVVDAGALPDLPAERIARCPLARCWSRSTVGVPSRPSRLHLLASGLAESSVLAASDVIRRLRKPAPRLSRAACGAG